MCEFLSLLLFLGGVGGSAKGLGFFLVGWFVWVIGFVWFRFFFCLVLGFCLVLILVGWFFYPLSNFRKNSLLWAKEESKTHVLKLFRTLHGKRHARE